MDKPERIIVTGAKGFAGSHIAAALLEAGHEVIKWHRAVVDLENPDQVRDAMHEQKPDWVIHAAGRVRGIVGNSGRDNNREQLRANRDMGENVIHAMVSASVRHGVILGSSCQYPKLAEQPFKVESLGTGRFEETNWGYAAAKEHVRRLATQFGYQFIIPPNLFGPGDKYERGEAHFFADFVRKIMTVQPDGRVHHLGSPDTKREILYAPRLGEMVAELVANPNVYRNYPVMNIGYGEVLEFTLGEIWDRLVHLYGKNPFVRWSGAQVGMPRKVMSVTHHLGGHSTPIDAWFNATLTDYRHRFIETLDKEELVR